MPGNTIKINELKELEWYVGDSGMDRVIKLLNEVGIKNEPSSDEEKVISITDKETTKMQMLDQWMKELIYPGDVKDFFQEVSGHGSPEEVKRDFCFYTKDHQYFINAIERKTGIEDDYLGCQVSARKARAGEDWIRGNDLPDGKFNKKTWDMIINAIVSYELVKLSTFQKPDTVPEDIA